MGKSALIAELAFAGLLPNPAELRLGLNFIILGHHPAISLERNGVRGNLSLFLQLPDELSVLVAVLQQLILNLDLVLDGADFVIQVLLGMLEG